MTTTIVLSCTFELQHTLQGMLPICVKYKKYGPLIPQIINQTSGSKLIHTFQEILT
jgi:hypothetical protein